MLKSFTAIFLACFFLAGSTILPLGDFALMTDLPGMYHVYSGVTKDSPNIVDFVGDYLFNGKELLGHNKHDSHPGTGLQFQHQANTLTAIVANFAFIQPASRESSKNSPLLDIVIITSTYCSRLFRPPVA